MKSAKNDMEVKVLVASITDQRPCEENKIDADVDFLMLVKGMKLRGVGTVKGSTKGIINNDNGGVLRFNKQPIIVDIELIQVSGNIGIKYDFGEESELTEERVALTVARHIKREGCLLY